MFLTRRRALGSIAAGIAAAALAACGQSAPTAAPSNNASSSNAQGSAAATAAPTTAASATTPQSAAQPTAAPTAAPQAASSGSSAGPVSLDVISWNSGTSADAFKSAMKAINDKYKSKAPNTTINFEMLGQGATWTNAQKTRIAAKKVDVTASYGFNPRDIINLQPDQQFLNLTGVAALKNFDQTYVNRFMVWKGKPLQMTLAFVGHVVWTDEDVLSKNGIEHPTTWSALQQVGDKLKANNVVPFIVGGKEGSALNRAWSMLEMSIVRPKSPRFWADLLTKGQADFTTPEWVQLFQRVKDVTKYYEPDFSGVSYPTTAGLFASGKYAMMPDGSFAGGDIEAAKPTFQKLGAYLMPGSDNAPDNATQPVYGDISWAGLNFSKSADQVRDWIDFFGQKDNYSTFMEGIKYYPTQSITLTGPVPEAESPLLKQTAVSMILSFIPGMQIDYTFAELVETDKYTPDSYAKFFQKQFEDSRPQWQKYLGTFDEDWAKLYFGF